MSGEFHADSVPISVKFNAAGVLNGAKRHRAWLSIQVLRLLSNEVLFFDKQTISLLEKPHSAQSIVNSLSIALIVLLVQ